LEIANVSTDPRPLLRGMKRVALVCLLAFLSATTTDGGFSFGNVPFNPYDLRVEAQGFAPS
jgi:hypothetical protein